MILRPLSIFGGERAGSGSPPRDLAGSAVGNSTQPGLPESAITPVRVLDLAITGLCSPMSPGSIRGLLPRPGRSPGFPVLSPRSRHNAPVPVEGTSHLPENKRVAPLIIPVVRPDSLPSTAPLLLDKGSKECASPGKNR